MAFGVSVPTPPGITCGGEGGGTFNTGPCAKPNNKKIRHTVRELFLTLTFLLILCMISDKSLNTPHRAWFLSLSPSLTRQGSNYSHSEQESKQGKYHRVEGKRGEGRGGEGSGGEKGGGTGREGEGKGRDWRSVGQG